MILLKLVSYLAYILVFFFTLIFPPTIWYPLIYKLKKKIINQERVKSQGLWKKVQIRNTFMNIKKKS